jgi:NAD(P)H-dependent FMN reductase
MFSRDRPQNRDKRLTRLIRIAGSRRAGSHDAALLRAASQLVPAGETPNVATIRGIPLDDRDVEAAEGIPGVVTALKDQIAAADGLLLVTPE